MAPQAFVAALRSGQVALALNLWGSWRDNITTDYTKEIVREYSFGTAAEPLYHVLIQSKMRPRKMLLELVKHITKVYRDLPYIQDRDGRRAYDVASKDMKAVMDDNKKLSNSVNEMKEQEKKLKGKLIKNKQQLTILKYHNNNHTLS